MRKDKTRRHKNYHLTTPLTLPFFTKIGYKFTFVCKLSPQR